nr:MAG TPA: hypothetical protein [Caudoviricetes sp.]DAH61106.1 MAG TPA: hypothetical protein [Caudoviricetes sp.]
MAAAFLPEHRICVTLDAAARFHECVSVSLRG